MKITKNNYQDFLETYFSDWAIKAGEKIDKKAKKEGWDNFDYTSAINFMLTDIRVDMIKFIKKILK